MKPVEQGYEDHVYWDATVLRGPDRDELAAALTAAVSDSERRAVHV